MSETDSFIEEVTDEVRKDRLYAYYKKYGWIVGLAIVLIVGGASYLEWSKSQAIVAAEARGDAIAVALSKKTPTEQVAALQSLSADAGAAAVLLQFQEATILIQDGQKGAALAALDKIAQSDSTSPIYRDLARFKALVLRGKDMDVAKRLTAFQGLATPGNALRPLALEQIAIAKLDAGDEKAAIDQLKQLLEEPNLPAGVQQRAIQLLVSLGGEIPAQAQLLSGNGTAQ
ncbi:MAG: hypothetical protein QM492_00745 [Rhodobacterales bacterium]